MLHGNFKDRHDGSVFTERHSLEISCSDEDRSARDARRAATGIVNAERKALLDSRAQRDRDAAFQAKESERNVLMLN